MTIYRPRRAQASAHHTITLAPAHIFAGHTYAIRWWHKIPTINGFTLHSWVLDLGSSHPRSAHLRYFMVKVSGPEGCWPARHREPSREVVQNAVCRGWRSLSAVPDRAESFPGLTVGVSGGGGREECSVRSGRQRCTKWPGSPSMSGRAAFVSM